MAYIQTDLFFNIYMELHACLTYDILILLLAFWFYKLHSSLLKTIMLFIFLDPNDVTDSHIHFCQIFPFCPSSLFCDLVIMYFKLLNILFLYIFRRLHLFLMARNGMRIGWCLYCMYALCTANAILLVCDITVIVNNLTLECNIVSSVLYRFCDT